MKRKPIGHSSMRKPTDRLGIGDFIGYGHIQFSPEKKPHLYLRLKPKKSTARVTSNDKK